MPPATRYKKKRRSSSGENGLSLKSLESLFSKQMMRVIGILFLGASMWFAANSTDTIFKVAKNLLSPKELIVNQTPGDSPGNMEALPLVPEAETPIPFTMGLITVVLMAGWLVMQLLARWRKRAEFQIISVFLVFIAILAMIRSFGWQPELMFSVLIILTGGFYFFGLHLSHTASRINFIFTWGLFSLWWLLKIMISRQSDQLASFFVLGSLIFLTFHVIQLLKGFAGRRTLSRYMEVFVIGANLGIYFILMAATILKFYGKLPLFLFTFCLSALYILSLIIMEFARKPFHKVPFLLSAIILVSLLLPFLFWSNKAILFAGSLSMLLLFYSRQTKDQPSVIIALALVVLMALIFAKDLVFVFLPVVFLGGLAGNESLFFTGLIEGLSISVVAFVDRWQLKNLEISYSRKWFSRKRYLVLLKGVFLTGLYLVLLWLWQYSWFAICGFDEAALVIWFSFHCLYCIVAIPWLSAQRSSFLPLAMIASSITSFAYPTLLSLQNIELADLYIRGIPAGMTAFPIHYLAAGLFLVYIAVVLQYTGNAFKGSTVAKRIFLVYAVVMVMFILVSEMVLTAVAFGATSQLQGNEIRIRMLGLPATLILFAGGVVTLAWGFVLQKRFGRTLAMILLFLAAFKLIYFDLKSISLFTRVVLLFVAGTVFIGLSLGYTQARKVFRKRRKHVSRTATPRFPKSEEIADQNPES